MSTNQPQGTFLPNTKVTVGSHKVYIEKYLSEGGFAHVYVVRIPRDNNKHEIAVLKRVAVPDKEHLANMRTEVETMKKLRGHKHIVTYIDSHASQLKGGGYEVFLLMEYCAGGGLIDFMNTRLQHRLTEPEILKIFGDCAEGVACMHYLKPPLLHRDLKVENVLISKSAGGSPTYKICDFGSAAQPRPAAKTAEEGRLIEEDVQKHTTMQYRSPEMIDVWRKQPIDEKADIWALGVLLYKLCYYTTPFEDVGQMAILNASYKYPSYPAFSNRLKNFIAWMLKEDPKQRPNIYQVVKEVCSMRGADVPIKDIYANRTLSEARKNESLPSAETMSSAPVGLQRATPPVQVQKVPEITPMRRGRPTVPSAQGPTAVKPAASPSRGDPFAALDSKSYDVRVGAVDELSKRFPSLDEFAIAHDGGKFAFPTSPLTGSQAAKGAAGARDSLNERVANALADDLFASKSPPPATAPAPSATAPPAAASTAPQSRPQTRQASPTKAPITVPLKEVRQEPMVQQPTPLRPGSRYKSTAVGSSPPPHAAKKPPEISSKPIWRVPDQPRASSQPRASIQAQSSAAALRPDSVNSARPALLEAHRTKSQTGLVQRLQASSSSRPSLEGGRPTANDAGETSVGRTRSLHTKSRPSSMYVSSDLDYLHDQEQARKRPSMEARRSSRQLSQRQEARPEETAIENDMEYLRQTEGNDLNRNRSMKEAMKIANTSHHRKRSSLDAVKSGAKNMLAGRFGDAFKRFENQQSDEAKQAEVAILTPEPQEYDQEPQYLSPIAGSEATAGRHSDMDSALDDAEDLPPDVRRELERRRLSQEERRVAEAAAAYRARVAAQETGSMPPSTRASTIQKRVQSLLDEGRQMPPPKTAEGYGRHTGVPSDTAQPNVPAMSGSRPPVIAQKPNLNLDNANNAYPKTRQQPAQHTQPQPPTPNVPSPSASAPPDPTSRQRPASRPGPNAPPKPKVLRTGGPSQWPPPQPDTDKPLPPKPSGLAALLAKDLEGVPDYPPQSSNGDRPSTAGDSSVPDVDLDTFSKRYPSLNLEMVETEISGRRA